MPPAPQPQEPRPQAQPPPVGMASAASMSEKSPDPVTTAAVDTFWATLPQSCSNASAAAVMGRSLVNFSLQGRQ